MKQSHSHLGWGIALAASLLCASHVTAQTFQQPQANPVTPGATPAKPGANPPVENRDDELPPRAQPTRDTVLGSPADPMPKPRLDADVLIGIGPPRTPPRQIKIIHLVHGDAVQYSALIKSLRLNVEITADSRTNQLIISAQNPEEVMEVEEILRALDTAGRPASAPDRVEAPDRKVEPTSVNLTGRIEAHEAEARVLAEHYREKSTRLGAQHPELTELRQQLSLALQAALNLKLQREELNVKQLEERLLRVRTQLEFRKAAGPRIVERRLNELLDGDSLNWSQRESLTLDRVDSPPVVPAARIPVAGFGMAPAPPMSSSEAFNPPGKEDPNLELTRNVENAVTQLELAAKRVRELELDYFRNRSGVADLQRAMDQWKQASVAERTARRLLDNASGVISDNGVDDLRILAPEEKLPPNFHPDMASRFLEATTSLKLELVELKGFRPPFQSALRVLESSDRFDAGDLIVAMNHRLFATAEQAVAGMSSVAISQSEVPVLVLRGGLSSYPRTVMLRRKLNREYLVPGFPEKALFELEVRVKVDDGQEIESRYFHGICVSPDGLIVLPLPPKSFAPDSPIVVYKPNKGTARILASDEKRCLTLLQLDVPGSPLFWWCKCRLDRPARRQLVEVPVGPANLQRAFVGETGLPYPEPRFGNDGFVMDFVGNFGILVGGGVFSVDHELQGVIVDVGVVKQDNLPDPMRRVLAIPAMHVQELIDQYRKPRMEKTW